MAEPTGAAPPPPGYSTGFRVGSALRRGLTYPVQATRGVYSGLRGGTTTTPPPPLLRPAGPTWIDRHGRTVVYGAAIGGGLIVGGLLIYALYQALIGSGGGPNNPPACTAATNAYNTDEADIQKIITANPAGLSGPQQAEVTALSTDAATQMGYIGQYCTPTCSGIVGCSIADVQAWMANYGAYLGWIIALPVVAGSALAVRYLLQRFGGSKKNGPDRPPQGPTDAAPPSTFTPAIVGSTVSTAIWIAWAEAGLVTPSQASAAVSGIAGTFPTTGVSDTWVSVYQAEAAATQNAVISQALIDYIAVALAASVIATEIAADETVALALIALL